MKYSIISAGASHSFPEAHPFLAQAVENGDVVFLIGKNAGNALSSIKGASNRTAIVVELDNECLGVHTGESRGEEGSNILGFARFRLGNGVPSALVELVKQPNTKPEAIAAAKAIFTAASLKVAICNDFPGRIINRLVRPYYNAALRRLDEGLATASDMDMTLKLGLGYPEGPISLLERSGLEHHFDVTNALYDALGEQAYAPARRAQVAKARSSQN